MFKNMKSRTPQIIIPSCGVAMIKSYKLKQETVCASSIDIEQSVCVIVTSNSFVLNYHCLVNHIHDCMCQLGLRITGG